MTSKVMSICLIRARFRQRKQQMSYQLRLARLECSKETRPCWPSICLHSQRSVKNQTKSARKRRKKSQLSIYGVTSNTNKCKLRKSRQCKTQVAKPRITFSRQMPTINKCWRLKRRKQRSERWKNSMMKLPDKISDRD